MIGYLIFAVALGGFLVASYTDVKIREVSNWLSFGLIFGLAGLRAVYAYFAGDWGLLWLPLLVGGIFFAIGMVFFYAGQWGGADAKLLAALGVGFAILPEGFSPLFVSVWPFYATLFFNFMLVAAIYSLSYSVIVASSSEGARRDFRASLTKYDLVLVGLSMPLLFMVSLYYSFLIWLVLIPPLFILSKFLKSVEKNCMVRTIPVKELREFDIPEKDLRLGKNVLVSSKDPNGMSPEQIKKVQELARKGKLPKRLPVRWGVPLIPAFPICLLVSLFLGDLVYGFLIWLV
jgi:Flp pilus assembly protein protease CpaA